MRDPFSNPRAMRPFFNETIVVTGNRSGGLKLKRSLKACVLTDMDADAISEDAAMSAVDSISVQVGNLDLDFILSLNRGDIIERVTGKRYAVASVTRDEALGTVVKARSIG